LRSVFDRLINNLAAGIHHHSNELLRFRK